MPQINKKKNILVISDSLEVFRQPHADIENYISGIFVKLFENESHYTCEFLHGNEAENVINNLDSINYDLIVFASNAIIRRESSIYLALVNNKDKLEKFVSSGNNVVFFHQGFSGTSSEVEFLNFVSAKNWVVADIKDDVDINFVVDEKHPILQFPNLINKDDFINKTAASPFYLCYYGVEVSGEILDSSVSKVVEINEPKNCIALMTYENVGRVIISPYPADWIKDEELLENIFYYALYGVVDKIAIFEDNAEDYYNMLITRMSANGNVIRFNDSDYDTKNFMFNYLAKNVDLFIFPNEELKAKYLKYNIMIEALERGADILVASNVLVSGDTFENFNYLIGKNNYQNNEITFNTIFSNMNRTNWFRTALIHDIRDVLMAAYDISYEGDKHNLKKFNKIVSTIKDELHERANTWLERNDITKDPITAVVSLWLVKIANYDLDKIVEYEIKFKEFIDDQRYLEVTLTLNTLLDTNKYTNIEFFDILNKSTNQLGSIIRFLDDYYMAKALGANVKLTDNSYNYIFNKLLEIINKKPKFFDQSESTVSMVATLIRFILDIPAHLPLKKRSSSLLNTLVDYISKNNAKQVSEENKEKIISIPLIIFASTINKVEKVFPVGLYYHFRAFDDNQQSEMNFVNSIKMLKNSINARDKKLDEQNQQFLDYKAKTDEEIKIMKIQSIVGLIATYLLFVVLTVIDIFFMIKAIQSLLKGKLELVEVVVPLTIAIATYGIFIHKIGFYKLQRKPKEEEKKDE